MSNAMSSCDTDVAMEGDDVMSYDVLEEYRRAVGPRAASSQISGSMPDSGHGTTSLASTGKHSYLREKLADIGRTLEVCILSLTNQVL